jgi:hypothetical protein
MLLLSSRSEMNKGEVHSDSIYNDTTLPAIPLRQLISEALAHDFPGDLQRT